MNNFSLVLLVTLLFIVIGGSYFYNKKPSSEVNVVTELQEQEMTIDTLTPQIALKSSDSSETLPSDRPGSSAIAINCETQEELNKATLTGIDDNQNGVRDDVDCYITEWYGLGTKSSVYASRYARALQASLVGKILYTEAELQQEIIFEYGNEPIAQQFIDSLYCVMSLDIYKELDPIDRIDLKTLNTPERKRKFSSLYAGVTLGGGPDEYCERGWMKG